MSTRRDATLDVPLLEPPTRVLSARELREQLCPASAALGAREPPTRLLSRAELAREIALAEAAIPDDPDEAITRWLPRTRLPAPWEPRTERLAPASLALRVGLPEDLTVTRATASELLAEVPRLGAAAVCCEPGPAVPEPSPPASAGPVAPRERRWALLGAGVAVALLVAAWFGSRDADPQRLSRRSPALSPATPTAPAMLSPAPSSAAPLPPGSPRQALDLLLAGQREHALDAYRALAHERPAESVYAHVVELLEREARSCTEAAPCP